MPTGTSTPPDTSWSIQRNSSVFFWALLVAGLFLCLCLVSLHPALRQYLPVPAEDLGRHAFILILAMTLLCEYVDSSIGMGYGTTLTPFLLLLGFEPLQIVPCVLLSELVSGLTAALLHHRHGNVDFLRDRKARQTVVLLSALSVLGTVAAVLFALNLPKAYLTAIIGVIILTIGVVIVATIRHRLRYRPTHMLAVGLVAAFNKGLSGGGYGPLVTAGQVVSGLSAKHAVAITSLAESLTCLVGIIAYLALGGRIDLPLAITLTTGALLSVPLATLTVRHLPEGVIRAAVGVVTISLGGLTLSKLLW